MKVMLNVQVDTPTGNALITNGKIGEVMETILAKLQPEAAYFYSRGGNRAFTLVVECPDAASIPSLAEPFWLSMNAKVELHPVMTADDLREGLGRLG